MQKKEIQEERMRGYFIQATKEMLKGEGLKSISVRNIADQAGYSYATIYNYFRDVKDLVFLCVQDFQDEIEAFIMDETKNDTLGTDRINGICTSYIKYFVQYPGIFELFYLERVPDIAHKQPTIDLINNFVDRLCETDWLFLESQKLYSNAEIQRKKNQLNTTLVGLLLNYLNRRQPADYVEFNENVNFQLESIVSKNDN